jgi:hypothetical protein
VRELTTHKINEANNQLTIRALDRPGPGGASHAYIVSGIKGFPANPSAGIARAAWDEASDGACLFVFQNGAIGEAGVNGITHEALLAILIDRLEAFQNGPYACEENAMALLALLDAQASLLQRTQRRAKAGIEGSMALDEVDPILQESPAKTSINKAGNPIMRFFMYDHLASGPLRSTSKVVCDLAEHFEAVLPAGAEKTHGMRKLLEAKDCFVRAALTK